MQPRHRAPSPAAHRAFLSLCPALAASIISYTLPPCTRSVAPAAPSCSPRVQGSRSRGGCASRTFTIGSRRAGRADASTLLRPSADLAIPTLMTTGHVHVTRPLTYLITAAEMYLHHPRLIDLARTWMKIRTRRSASGPFPRTVLMFTGCFSPSASIRMKPVEMLLLMFIRRPML
jgi:hypothetical protein